MKFRTVALALALGFGLTAASEARPRQVHKAANRRSKARAVKPRKFKRKLVKH